MEDEEIRTILHDDDRTLIEKIKGGLLGSLYGTLFALWIFDGPLGAIIAVFRGDLEHAILSGILPLYGTIYTIVIIVGSVF